MLIAIPLDAGYQQNKSCVRIQQENSKLLGLDRISTVVLVIYERRRSHGRLLLVSRLWIATIDGRPVKCAHDSFVWVIACIEFTVCQGVLTADVFGHNKNSLGRSI